MGGALPHVLRFVCLTFFAPTVPSHRQRSVSMGAVNFGRQTHLQTSMIYRPKTTLVAWAPSMGGRSKSAMHQAPLNAPRPPSAAVQSFNSAVSVFRGFWVCPFFALGITCIQPFFHEMCKRYWCFKKRYWVTAESPS